METARSSCPALPLRMMSTMREGGAGGRERIPPPNLGIIVAALGEEELMAIGANQSDGRGISPFSVMIHNFSKSYSTNSYITNMGNRKLKRVC